MTIFETDVIDNLAKVFPKNAITAKHEFRNGLPGYRVFVDGERTTLWLSVTICDDIVLQSGMSHDQAVIRVATAMANTIAQYIDRNE